MELEDFIEILKIDSTSSKERELAEYLEKKLDDGICRVERHEVGDGTLNLMFSWGTPDIVFCTHMDTVPPYIPPSIRKESGRKTIFGRGSCDAKGQIYAMYRACRRLADSGESGFGLLLVSGEECGSKGAIKAAGYLPETGTVIVGEPTDNMTVSASKGTMAFDIEIKGIPFHSGYPEYGKSAIDMFIDFMNGLNNTVFPEDPLLGKTTYNVGMLKSDNPRNILSGILTFSLYFRTTFASCDMIEKTVLGLCVEGISAKPLGGDRPMEYLTTGNAIGIKSKPVSFGSDAPRLNNFRNRMIMGAGSILVAHTENEHVTEEELDKATENYIELFRYLKSNNI